MDDKIKLTYGLETSSRRWVFQGTTKYHIREIELRLLRRSRIADHDMDRNFIYISSGALLHILAV
jgi:hypothetical protein